MKPKTPDRRCTECSRAFDPDPRVGDRQVTCGAQACQASRHAKQCLKWREANRDVARRHYDDVVVPYRRKRPWYQRGWRWMRRLGEIREEMKLAGRRLLAGARGLVLRTEKLLERVPVGAQTGLFSRDVMVEAAGALGAVVAALGVAERGMVKLAALGT